METLDATELPPIDLVQVTSGRIGRCIWCQRPGVEITADHVFPAALGGTRDLSVPACPTCQGNLSVAERELSRRSTFAVWRHTRDFTVPAKKRRKDPSSGSIEARYILRKDPDGLYREVAVRGGQGVALPCIQIDIAHLLSGDKVIADNEVIGHADGVSPDDVNRLVDTLLRAISGPPDESGFVGSLDVQLLDEHDAAIMQDTHFWPRIYLDLAGRVRIRARSGEEAQQFAAVFVDRAVRGYFRDHSSWRGGEIGAGTPHRLRLEWDERKVLRMIAKIPYGLAYLKAGPEVTECDPWPLLRAYIVGETPDSVQSPVKETEEPGAITEWPEYHLAAVEPVRGALRGLVSIYGACHVVDFGSDHEPVIRKPVVAVCRRSGAEAGFIEGEAAARILGVLRDHAD